MFEISSPQIVHEKSRSQVEVTFHGHFWTDDVDCALTQVLCLQVKGGVSESGVT